MAAMDSRIIILGTVVSLIAGVLLAVLFEYLQVSGLLQNLQKLSENASQETKLSESGEAASIG